MRELILASTSRYRAQLLQRLGHTFRQLSPDCDETPKRQESPFDLVQRLSIEKAMSVAKLHHKSIVIGSDQVADLDGRVIGKPKDRADAKRQLADISNREINFHTGLCVTCVDTQQCESLVCTTTVRFRDLQSDEIERYLDADKPYDCACSFRSESLGSAIVDGMRSDDPTALIGLPIIHTARLLRLFGLQFP